ncbi:hypothetical protein Naga_100692g1 [Nannochloropsis gaditana]|uniref:Uncharacterized protein n=1 Tax=Nannochloropsis gaditana TaxID=72520 RepID=W7TAV3_9STRA|nr:hypothetical protein Naga_100692g1 [Nannochloropsis gaditana]
MLSFVPPPSLPFSLPPSLRPRRPSHDGLEAATRSPLPRVYLPPPRPCHPTLARKRDGGIHGGARAGGRGESVEEAVGGGVSGSPLRSRDVGEGGKEIVGSGEAMWEAAAWVEKDVCH